jgi:hypothetical protein
MYTAYIVAQILVNCGKLVQPPPRLTGSQKSDLVRRRMPSTQSSMYVKERVWLPSPHISTSVVAVAALRQNAAGAFE